MRERNEHALPVVHSQMPTLTRVVPRPKLLAGNSFQARCVSGGDPSPGAVTAASQGVPLWAAGVRSRSGYQTLMGGVAVLMVRPTGPPRKMFS